ncbi:tetratricopeptide repeat protein [Chlorobium sp. N1]|uniref:tetratricopeptide repeat protein n=1 Tax=Chlorobium sp. N1 TaxID=2491138 RepID=UPI00103FA988|nr:tetratricopeptide repeat protein [Chlorobium sp. N1]TCD48794.1 tetratricopeptide repeat protein [Chlorobium sp. N1]
MLKDAMGAYRGTEGELSRFIEERPLDPMAWFDRGNARSSRGEWDGAEKDYTMALKTGLRFREAIVALGNRGMCRAREGDLDGAIEDFTAIIEKRPNNRLLLRAAFRSRAEMKEKSGDRDGAAADRRLADLLPAEQATT